MCPMIWNMVSVKNMEKRKESQRRQHTTFSLHSNSEICSAVTLPGGWRGRTFVNVIILEWGDVDFWNLYHRCIY